MQIRDCSGPVRNTASAAAPPAGGARQQLTPLPLLSLRLPAGARSLWPDLLTAPHPTPRRVQSFRFQGEIAGFELVTNRNHDFRKQYGSKESLSFADLIRSTGTEGTPVHEAMSCQGEMSVSPMRPPCQVEMESPESKRRLGVGGCRSFLAGEGMFQVTQAPETLPWPCLHSGSGESVCACEGGMIKNK